jgi:hypothetical protein
MCGGKMASELKAMLERAAGGKYGRIAVATIDGIVNGAILEKSETAFVAKTVAVVALKALGFDIIPDSVADADAGCLGMKLYLMIKGLVRG